MIKETGGPAFPVEAKLNPISNQACKYQTDDGHVYQFPGMTLRDYFAAKAMQQLVVFNHADHEVIAKACYHMADAMLKARNT